jgi:hypothetical protein
MKVKLRKRLAGLLLVIVTLPQSWLEHYKTKTEDRPHIHPDMRGLRAISRRTISTIRLRLGRTGSFTADAFLVKNTWLRRHFPRIYVLIHGGG